MKALTIRRLYSGGLITNYYCSSKCRHCLYGCSPGWEKKYMDEDMACALFRKIKSLGCYSVHIGGGEPLLDAFSLEKTLGIARAEGISIEYIETNSSWYRDTAHCTDVLNRLKSLGVGTLLISISPFHNEYVPFYKVKSLIQSCTKAGMSVFPWIQEFIPDLNALDDTKPHSLDEYRHMFGSSYIEDIPRRFHLNMRGRAMLSYKDYYPHQNLSDILSENKGCRELEGVSHFHFDLFGNYIPGLCAGMSVHVGDMGAPLQAEEYPFLTVLYSEGISGFLRMAQQEYGFAPQEKYFSKCHLCFAIRKFLVMEKGLDTRELQPVEHYKYI